MNRFDVRHCDALESAGVIGYRRLPGTPAEEARHV